MSVLIIAFFSDELLDQIALFPFLLLRAGTAGLVAAADALLAPHDGALEAEAQADGDALIKSAFENGLVLLKVKLGQKPEAAEGET